MEAIKAIVSKNSVAALVLGTLLIVLGAVSEISIGTLSIKTNDLTGRVTLIVLGTGIIGLGAFFAYLEYNSINLSKKSESTQSRNEDQVTYRSKIRLIHLSTKMALHSHSHDYYNPGSSKQQQVTGYGNSNSDDYWIVKGPHGRNEFSNQGKSIQNGEIIRFEHLNTRKNLHSHSGFQSPESKQQEVTAYGNDGVGNSDDNWRVDVEDGGKWKDGSEIRLIHVNTNVALHSHPIISEYTSNQQEVTGYHRRNQDDIWIAELIK